jgi:hypothetical protein
MADDPQPVSALLRRLSQIDFFGVAGPPMPASDGLAEAIGTGAPLLPAGYIPAFVNQVTSGLPRLLGLQASGQIHPGSLEMVAGAIYQHDPQAPMAIPLRRFTAVVSNLFLSFLDDAKRASLALPPAERLPPLAVYRHDGSDGPITIPVDLIARVVGGGVGVVALPATFADHPVLWAALAHEVGGHDVIHAEPGLLDELIAGLPTTLAGLSAGPLDTASLIALWTWWLDEASADIYGLLNIGPTFAENLAVVLAALGQSGTAGAAAPTLRLSSEAATSDSTDTLDPHPTDVLRLHLALGALDTLSGLAPATRAAYAQRIADLEAALSAGDSITIAGTITDAAGGVTALHVVAPRVAMQQAARAVGAFIATTNLAALGGHSVQALETWNDADEAVAQSIRAAFAAGQAVRGLGDAAQLLAGATLAVLDAPARYDQVTQSLNDALDTCFQNDPIWGLAPVDRMYLKYQARLGAPQPP